MVWWDMVLCDVVVRGLVWYAVVGGVLCGVVESGVMWRDRVQGDEVRCGRVCCSGGFV